MIVRTDYALHLISTGARWRYRRNEAYFEYGFSYQNPYPIPHLYV